MQHQEWYIERNGYLGADIKADFMEGHRRITTINKELLRKLRKKS